MGPQPNVAPCRVSVCLSPSRSRRWSSRCSARLRSGRLRRDRVLDVVPFAKNSSAVNGIKASRQPTPGRLLPARPRRPLPGERRAERRRIRVRPVADEGEPRTRLRTVEGVRRAHAPGDRRSTASRPSRVSTRPTRSRVVSPEWGNSAGPNNLFVYANAAGKHCPAGTYEVRTYQYATSEDAKPDVKFERQRLIRPARSLRGPGQGQARPRATSASRGPRRARTVARASPVVRHGGQRRPPRSA